MLKKRTFSRNEKLTITEKQNPYPVLDPLDRAKIGQGTYKMTTIDDNEGLAGYTRVTEFLTPYKDFSAVPQDVLAKACARGDLAHTFCDLYALNLLIEKPPLEIKPYFDSFKFWYDNFVDETIMTETRVSHPEYLITGQFDWIGKLKGSDEIVLADWKTPKTTCVSWALQMAAYRFLLRETMGIDVQRRLSIRLSHEGKPPEVTEYLDHDKDERIFLNQVEIYRFFNPKIKAL